MAGKENEGAPAPSQKKPASVTRMQAPQPGMACGGASGRSYRSGKDGIVEVDSEDVPALINAGFTAVAD